jgi:hypothetical protein
VNIRKVIWSDANAEVSFLSRMTRNFRFFEEPVTAATRAALQLTGRPSVKDAKTPKEDALGLLQLAAEIEHALMVQYLYAAWSVGTNTAARKLMEISVQEMGHFMTIQNLLLALGGVSAEGAVSEFHLARDTLRKSSSLNPLRFVLEPVTRKSLAKYVAAERPSVIDDEALKKLTDELVDLAAEDGFTPVRVGVLYASLLWLFMPSDDYVTEVKLHQDMGFPKDWHLKESDFASPADINSHAATIAEWGSRPGLIVHPATTPEQRVSALEQIIAQGEGLQHSEGSHFQQFIDLVGRFDNNQLKVLNLPHSPYLGADVPTEDPDAVQITDSYLQEWARLFNLYYEQLMLDIAWSMYIPAGNAVRGEWIVSNLRETMSNLQEIAFFMRDHEIDGSKGHAGPPFHLGNVDVPKTKAAFLSRSSSMQASRQAILEAIKRHERYQTCENGTCTVTDYAAESLLENLAIDDQKRHTLMTT